MGSFTEEEFRLTFRVRFRLFNKILAKIRPRITTLHVAQANRSSVGEVIPEVRLCCALRWLAGGAVTDIARIHRVSRAEVYKTVWIVADAINESYPFSFPASDDLDGLLALERGFRSKSSRQCFKGCVGAVDGITVKIRRPRFPTETLNPARFFCGRKKFFCLNLQAVCDFKCRFTFADIRYPGSSSDSLAFRSTSLGQCVLKDNLPNGLFLVGDAAYTLTNSLLTPYPGLLANIGVAADAYNFYLSQQRITIERAFGIPVRRFGCLWRSLECRFDRAAQVAVCCMRIHNLCIDDGDCDFGSSDLDAASAFKG